VIYSDLVIADGASNYWRLGETSGTSAADAVGGKTGTISGGVTLNQPGALSDGSKAMTFDGTTGKIVTAVNVTAPLTCSIEAWIKCANVDDTNFRVIVTNRDLTPEAAIFVAVSENKVYVYCAPSALISNRSVTDGQWHHVVFVSDGTSGWVYIDGVLDNTNLALPRGVVSHPVGIGYDIKTDGYYFPGSLDDIAFYPRALSAAEILTHYQTGIEVPSVADPRLSPQDDLAYPSPASPYPQTGLPYQYTYPAPTLTALTPASVSAANNLGFVTINATGTYYTNAMRVRLAGVLNHWRVYSILYRDPTSLQITLDVRGIGAGTYPVILVGQDGQATASLPFTVT